MLSLLFLTFVDALLNLIFLSSVFLSKACAGSAELADRRVSGSQASISARKYSRWLGLPPVELSDRHAERVLGEFSKLDNERWFGCVGA